MTDDEIELGLAAWGVPVFSWARVDWPRPDPADLMRACLSSSNSRYKNATIALLLSLPERESRSAVERLRIELAGRPARWLRWSTFAAEYLGRMYKSELTMLRAPPPKAPTDLFERGALPPPDEMFGEWGLTLLADEIATVEGCHIDWRGSLRAPVTDLTNMLWTERMSKHAKDDHAGRGQGVPQRAGAAAS